MREEENQWEEMEEKEENQWKEMEEKEEIKDVMEEKRRRKGDENSCNDFSIGENDGRGRKEKDRREKEGRE